MLQIIDLSVSDEDLLWNVGRVIKSERNRLARRVAHKGETRDLEQLGLEAQGK
jgi:hypothetical protein